MFILKKLISQILFPMSLIFWISAAGLILLWFTKRQKTGKALVSIGLFLVFFLSFTPVSSMLLKPLERTYNPEIIQFQDERSTLVYKQPIKFIAVLGGGHISDSKLPITSQIGNETLVRLIEGIRIYNKCPGSKLIVSGGSFFDPVSDAVIMADLAKELGVDAKNIIIESESKDTNDEAALLKPLLGNNYFFLVTSASHMPRSIAMFTKLGMNPIAAPTGHLVIDSQVSSFYGFFPGAYNLVKSERAYYEYLGIIWATLRGQI